MKTFKTTWKQNIEQINKSNRAAGYFLLHDLILDRDPKRSGFTPITNTNKLTNGQDPWRGLKSAKLQVVWLMRSNDALALKLIEESGVSKEEITDRLNAIFS